MSTNIIHAFTYKPEKEFISTLYIVNKEKPEKEIISTLCKCLQIQTWKKAHNTHSTFIQIYPFLSLIWKKNCEKIEKVKQHNYHGYKMWHYVGV